MPNIPLAVAPSVLGPGLYLLVNLLAGSTSPGTQQLRPIIMSPKSTAGTLVEDTEIRLIGSAADADIAWGTGTPGALAAKRYFEENPTGVLYGIAPTKSSGSTASGSATFSLTGASVVSSYTVRWTIAGRVIDVQWNAGEVLADVQSRSVTMINQLAPELAATASAGSSGIVNLNFKVPGPWGNDCLYSVQLLAGSGAGVTLAGPKLTGGTTEPDFTTALATISGQRYDFILAVVSNADAVSSSATSNPGRIRTAINGGNTGLNAKLELCIVGVTGSSQSSAKAGAIAKNDPIFEYVFCLNGQSLPCEFAAAELGARIAAITIDPAANRIGTAFDPGKIFGAADLVADTPTAPEIEDALANGVSIINYTAQGVPIMARPITTHSQDPSGNADRRCFDTSGVDGIYAVANDLEVALPAEFPQAKISKDLAAGEEPPPDGVVQERDVLSFVITRLRFWETRGVVRKDKLDEAIANGTIIVRVNPSDETQVDLVVPPSIVKPLAKFGLVVNKAA